MIDRAIDLAKTSDYPQHKLGAIVTKKNGRIIAKGVNQAKTHPMQAKYAKRSGGHRMYLHAEIAALVKCREQPHTLYVARHRRDGNVGIAKPCEVCMEAIREAGVKRIVYTKSIGGIGIIDL